MAHLNWDRAKTKSKSTKMTQAERELKFLQAVQGRNYQRIMKWCKTYGVEFGWNHPKDFNRDVGMPTKTKTMLTQIDKSKGYVKGNTKWVKYSDL